MNKDVKLEEIILNVQEEIEQETTLEEKLEDIIKINVDFISNKNGINLEDSNKLPGVLAYLLERIARDHMLVVFDKERNRITYARGTLTETGIIESIRKALTNA